MVSDKYKKRLANRQKLFEKKQLARPQKEVQQIRTELRKNERLEIGNPSLGSYHVEDLAARMFSNISGMPGPDSFNQNSR